ncbi:conjugal transfer protein TraC [Rhizobium sp. LjRoot258]|uniref:conjugal transfer protein TraC n=1 Tax=Rhizobium sp. LjRoot258 TaxID=3342299 RepID=UPI003ED0C45D
MKKPSAKIREEIARLQDQLKQAETREAERIGRIALKAGLGDLEVEETDLQAAFEDLAKRFRAAKPAPNLREKRAAGGASSDTLLAPGAAQGNVSEA